jgi:hypothetical protein
MIIAIFPPNTIDKSPIKDVTKHANHWSGKAKMKDVKFNPVTCQATVSYYFYGDLILIPKTLV